MPENDDFNFTATEMNIYVFLISHKTEVMDSNLRDLAKQLHVAPASVLRCIKKMGCNSFYELKFNFRNQQVVHIDSKKNYLIDIERDFFNRSLVSDYRTVIENIKKIITKSQMICFAGIGTSGILAEYGARQFANFGIDAFYNKDPYYPYQLMNKNKNSMVLIVLSVSGETHEAIKQIISLKNLKCKIISITNTSYSTIAKLSDINISYNVSAEVFPNSINVTTQIPVLFLLEYLARELIK